MPCCAVPASGGPARPGAGSGARPGGTAPASGPAGRLRRPVRGRSRRKTGPRRL